MTTLATPSRRRVRLFQVDAFTDRPLTGNPAGVVLDAGDLEPGEMQAIARELGNPETAFVLPERSSEGEVEVRFFTPTREVPVCGHATLAAHYVRAMRRDVRAGESIRQRSAGGVWGIEVERHEGDVRVWTIQKPVTFGSVLPPRSCAGLLAALGLEPSDLRSDCPVRVVSTGHPKVMVGLRSRGKLDAIVPDGRALAEISKTLGEDGVFVFALESTERDVRTECRMFAPALGIDEDPVTGSGHGPLGAYLVRLGLVPVEAGVARFQSVQGRAMGRPGHVDVAVEVEAGEPVRVRVGGRAVVVFSAVLEL